MGGKKEAMGIMRKIFVLHGWAYSADKWGPFIKFMERRGTRPILLNVPGLTRKTTKAWTIDDYLKWLKEKLEKEKEPPILIGHSNGGRLAIAFASKYPEKLNYLVLIDSAGIYHNEFPLRLKRFIFKNIAGLGKKITSSEKLRNLLYKVAREGDYKNATLPMRQTMVNLISLDLTSCLSRTTTPTLIIWGKLDRTTLLSDGKLMHKLIKDSKLYVVDDAGHSPQFTHAEQVCKRILEEIGSL